MSIRKAVLIGTLALGLAGAGSTEAFAGTHPTPTPTVPVPTPVVAHPWQFDVQQSDIAGLAVNDVEGTGAIPMHRWVDVASANPAIDTFQLGANSVTLRHSRLRDALLDVNPYTCTATVNQLGRFRIIRGTGTGANLRSLNGRFVLEGLLSFPLTRSGFCVLRFAGSGRILRAIEAGLPVLGVSPTFTDFSVQGRAQVFRVAPPAPRPFFTPSDTASPYLAPADIPTNS